MNDLKGILISVLLIIKLIASTNIDCNGKPFHCMNSTHFMICVDLGSGVSITIDDFVIPCPPMTVCQRSNLFECEFPTITTTVHSLEVMGVNKQIENSESVPVFEATDKLMDTTLKYEPDVAPLQTDLISVATTTPVITVVTSDKDINSQNKIKQERTTTHNPKNNITEMIGDIKVIHSNNKSKNIQTDNAESIPAFEETGKSERSIDTALSVQPLQKDMISLDTTTATSFTLLGSAISDKDINDERIIKQETTTILYNDTSNATTEIISDVKIKFSNVQEAFNETRILLRPIDTTLRYVPGVEPLQKDRIFLDSKNAASGGFLGSIQSEKDVYDKNLPKQETTTILYSATSNSINDTKEYVDNVTFESSTHKSNNAFYGIELEVESSLNKPETNNMLKKDMLPVNETMETNVEGRFSNINTNYLNFRGSNLNSFTPLINISTTQQDGFGARVKMNYSDIKVTPKNITTGLRHLSIVTRNTSGANTSLAPHILNTETYNHVDNNLPVKQNTQLLKHQIEKNTSDLLTDYFEITTEIELDLTMNTTDSNLVKSSSNIQDITDKQYLSATSHNFLTSLEIPISFATSKNNDIQIKNHNNEIQVNTTDNTTVNLVKQPVINGPQKGLNHSIKEIYETSNSSVSFQNVTTDSTSSAYVVFSTVLPPTTFDSNRTHAFLSTAEYFFSGSMLDNVVKKNRAVEIDVSSQNIHAEQNLTTMDFDSSNTFVETTTPTMLVEEIFKQKNASDVFLTSTESILARGNLINHIIHSLDKHNDTITNNSNENNMHFTTNKLYRHNTEKNNTSLKLNHTNVPVTNEVVSIKMTTNVSNNMQEKSQISSEKTIHPSALPESTPALSMISSTQEFSTITKFINGHIPNNEGHFRNTLGVINNMTANSANQSNINSQGDQNRIEKSPTLWTNDLKTIGQKNPEPIVSIESFPTNDTPSTLIKLRIFPTPSETTSSTMKYVKIHDPKNPKIKNSVRVNDTKLNHSDTNDSQNIARLNTEINWITNKTNIQFRSTEKTPLIITTEDSIVSNFINTNNDDNVLSTNSTYDFNGIITGENINNTPSISFTTNIQIKKTQNTTNNITFVLVDSNNFRNEKQLFKETKMNPNSNQNSNFEQSSIAPITIKNNENTSALRNTSSDFPIMYSSKHDSLLNKTSTMQSIKEYNLNLKNESNQTEIHGYQTTNLTPTEKNPKKINESSNNYLPHSNSSSTATTTEFKITDNADHNVEDTNHNDLNNLQNSKVKAHTLVLNINDSLIYNYDSTTIPLNEIYIPTKLNIVQNITNHSSSVPYDETNATQLEKTPVKLASTDSEFNTQTTKKYEIIQKPKEVFIEGIKFILSNNTETNIHNYSKKLEHGDSSKFQNEMYQTESKNIEESIISTTRTEKIVSTTSVNIPNIAEVNTPPAASSILNSTTQYETVTPLSMIKEYIDIIRKAEVSGFISTDYEITEPNPVYHNATVEKYNGNKSDTHMGKDKIVTDTENIFNYSTLSVPKLKIYESFNELFSPLNDTAIETPALFEDNKTANKEININAIKIDRLQRNMSSIIVTQDSEMNILSNIKEHTGVNAIENQQYNQNPLIITTPIIVKKQLQETNNKIKVTENLESKKEIDTTTPTVTDKADTIIELSPTTTDVNGNVDALFNTKYAIENKNVPQKVIPHVVSVKSYLNTNNTWTVNKGMLMSGNITDDNIEKITSDTDYINKTSRALNGPKTDHDLPIINNSDVNSLFQQEHKNIHSTPDPIVFRILNNTFDFQNLNHVSDPSNILPRIPMKEINMTKVVGERRIDVNIPINTDKFESNKNNGIEIVTKRNEDSYNPDFNATSTKCKSNKDKTSSDISQGTGTLKENVTSNLLLSAQNHTLTLMNETSSTMLETITVKSEYLTELSPEKKYKMNSSTVHIPIVDELSVRKSINMETKDGSQLNKNMSILTVNLSGNSLSYDKKSFYHNKSDFINKTEIAYTTNIRTNKQANNTIKKITFTPNNTTNEPIGVIDHEPKNDTQFSCRNISSGRYADNKDCRKFYICVGALEPTIGVCPVNTVFSDLNKQCTRNLSHCVRNNQFLCLREGRFSDFFRDNIYYICVKNSMNKFLRYKLQCQHGYYLNETTVRCELNKETSSESRSSVSEHFQKSNDSSTSGSFYSKSKEDIKFECRTEGTFSDPEDCRKYYTCSRNIKSEYRRRVKFCGSDEVFHRKKEKCVDNESYECWSG